MTIIEALKSKNPMVIVSGSREMYWAIYKKKWIVVSDKLNNFKILIETESEEEAVNELLK